MSIPNVLEHTELLDLETRRCIATAEVSLLDEKLSHDKYQAERDIDHLKSVLEEIRLRVSETRKDTYDFTRDCVIQPKNHDIKHSGAEKIKRHYSDKLISKKNNIEKLWNRNKSLTARIEMLEKKIKIKSEHQGYSKGYGKTDLEQLKILNTLYHKEVKTKTIELLDLKSQTGNFSQILLNYKNTLNDMDRHNVELHKSILKKKKTKEVFNIENANMIKEIEQYQENIAQIKSKISNTDMPKITDYIAQKSKEQDLKKEIKKWKKRVEIAEIEKKNTKAKYKKLKKQTQNNHDINRSYHY